MTVDDLADLIADTVGPDVAVHNTAPGLTVFPAVVLTPGDPWLSGESLRGITERTLVTIRAGRYDNPDQLDLVRGLYLSIRRALRAENAVAGSLEQPIILDDDGTAHVAATFTVTFPLDQL